MTPMTRRRMRPWLGTYVTVEAGMDTEAEALRVIEAAFARVAEVHLAMSFHSADSEIARLHREAAHRPTPVGEHTWSVLALTLRLAALSDGVFDPTVAASLVRHGALPRPDGPAPHPRATWRDIELLDDRHVRFHRPLWLDLGGIAKGHAVDCAIDAMLELGASHALVNAGGDLRIAGERTEGLPLTIRAPDAPHRHLPLGVLSTGAAATSGDFLFGRSDPAPAISPLVDPHKGVRPAQARSVTVLAPTCALADGLTKIVGLRDTASLPVLRLLDAHAAILDTPDTLQVTDGFWQQLVPPPYIGPALHV